MTWGAPLWGLALLGVAALAAVVAWGAARHRRRLATRFGGEILARVLPRGVRLRRAVRDVATLLGLAAVVVALAEPRYGMEVREAKKRGVDLVLLVDLSRSMDAQDVDPSRLERVKREIHDLLEVVQDDRIGLVVFAGGAYPRMPLSSDHDAVRMLVDELDTDVFRAQGSAVGEAIRVGLELLDVAISPADRALILFSDGEIHDVDAATEAAREAAAAGVRIYAVGVGDEPAPIPLEGGGWLTDAGQTVLTTPSPANLRALARATGGAYVPSVVSAQDMRELYEDEIRAELRATEVGTVRAEVWKSGFQWPLGVGLLLLLLGAWVGEGRRLLGSAGLLLLVVLPASARAGDRAEGDALYRAGRYPEAVELFRELTVEHPGDPDLWERLGAARYRAGDFEGAARAYDTQSRLLGDDGIDADFNSGNSHYGAGRLEEALERYDRVLARDPDHPGAGHNRTVVLEELTTRREVAAPKPKLKPGLSSEQGKPEPADGQQGEPGEGSSEGDPSQPGEGQEGSDQQARPGSEGAQPRPGEGASASAEQTGEGSQAEGAPREPGEGDQGRGDDSTSETVGDLEGLQTEGGGGDEPGEPFSGDPSQDGPVTAAQAERMLEGVREGRPRLEVGATGEGNPW